MQIRLHDSTFALFEIDEELDVSFLSLVVVVCFTFL